MLPHQPPCIFQASQVHRPQRLVVFGPKTIGQRHHLQTSPGCLQLCPSGRALLPLLLLLGQVQALSLMFLCQVCNKREWTHLCLVKVGLPPAASIPSLPRVCYAPVGYDSGHYVQPLCASVLICKPGDEEQLSTIRSVLRVDYDNISKLLAQCSVDVSYY